MVFSSLVFLFVFLVIHLIVYTAVPGKWHNAVLLVSSLIFYSWGGPQYLLLLVGITYDAKTKEHRCTIEEYSERGIWQGGSKPATGV